MIRIGINGLGRIGRCVLRALYELNYTSDIKLVALNTPGEPKFISHLLQYDSVHSTFYKPVSYKASSIVIDQEEIPLYKLRNPEDIPWKDHAVDVVIECSGAFKDRYHALKHTRGGAKKVLISSPAVDPDKTIIFGVNHKSLTDQDIIVSIGSCTTNCLAPVINTLHKAFSIKSASMTTIHAYTNDQNIVDNNHKDLRRGRACQLSIIPTETGAAKMIGNIIPDLAGKVNATALRVPVPNVSLIDLTFLTNKDTSVEKIHAVMQAAADEELKGVLSICSEPLVSIDFNHNSSSAIFDTSGTYVMPANLSRIIAWYDNEWGFSVRLLDVVKLMK